MPSDSASVDPEIARFCKSYDELPTNVGTLQRGQTRRKKRESALFPWLGCLGGLSSGDVVGS
jgi:hypothetical protein